MPWGSERRRTRSRPPLPEAATLRGEVLFAHERTRGLLELDCLVHGVPRPGDPALRGDPLHLTALLPEDDADARSVLNLLAAWRRAAVPVRLEASWSRQPRWVALHHGKQHVLLPLQVLPWDQA